ncbi:phosphatase PAP2 family protein [Galbibacter sp. EGI 63066]|uniref:phosphatase PAP2 family protein n=1 Tax=Galbibacter sp. EGI 63066 TaxID=2993559 RepID=UPI0022491506|nr:phosphatase PAP2 family protein [Galbibacter sp. EGI 63066]MCX2680276.1 phosphatase PAP2 family protein [Galbibacter sp. EGI 63066]
MIDKLIEYDQRLFLFLNSLGNESWDGFWMFMTNKWASIPLYVFLLILCLRSFKWKKTLLILILVALMIAATDQLANAFKYGFERLRPCHQEGVQEIMRLVKSYCGGKFGYFSAHASNSMAVVAFFSILFSRNYKWLPFLLIVWGITVAYSRIYIGVHYPLDVITGISIGMLLGWLFSKLFMWIVEKGKL